MAQQPLIFIEPCCGAAAVTLHLLGGPKIVPPVSWMGGKRRYARHILEALGLEEGLGARQVLLCDPGPWGWVWPVLLDPHRSSSVADRLRSWSTEEPRALWERLRSAPLPQTVEDAAASWLWLQGRAASGLPMWWRAGWMQGRQGGVADQPARQKGHGSQGLMRPETVADRIELLQDHVASWLALQHYSPGGVPVVDTEEGWRLAGDPWPNSPDLKKLQFSDSRTPGLERHSRHLDSLSEATRTWRAPQNEKASLKPALGPSGRWDSKGFVQLSPSAIRKRSRKRPRPVDITESLEHLHFVLGGRMAVYHGSCLDLKWPKRLDGAAIYFDPPYRRATGYGFNLGEDAERARAALLDLVQMLADRGARVAVSEGEPLDLPGWETQDITPLGRTNSKPEFLHLSQPSPARRHLVIGGAGSHRRPLLKWPGGKARQAKMITRALSGCTTGRWIEPFLGSGSVYLTAAAAGRVDGGLLGDVNEKLMAFHQAVRDEAENVITELGRLPRGPEWRKDYYDNRSRFNAMEPEGASFAAMMLWINKGCTNGLWRVNKAGNFNASIGSYSVLSLPAPDHIRTVSRLLRRATLKCSDWRELVDQAGPGDLVYADPPFWPRSKTSNFTSYDKSGFSLDDQRELAQLLAWARDRGAEIIAQNSWVPGVVEIYRDLGFEIIERTGVTRSIGLGAGKKGLGREAVSELLAIARRPRAMSTFGGPGGADLGIERAGVEVVASIERENAAASTQRAAGRPVIQADVKRVARYERFLDAPIWWSSPPCQGFSSAGQLAGSKDPRNGIPLLFKAIDKAQQTGIGPRWLLIENVSGLTHHLKKSGCNKGASPNPELCARCYLDHTVVPGLRERFAHAAWWKVNCADWGLPQKRIRIIIAAGPLVLSWPAPTHARGGAGGLLPWRSMRSALEKVVLDADSRPRTKADEDGVSRTITGRGSNMVVEPEVRFFGGGTNPRMPNADHQREQRDLTEEPSTTIVGAYGNSWHWVEVHRGDEPSPTVTTTCSQGMGGGWGRDDLERIFNRRSLKWHENAVLQDFPKDYPVMGNVQECYQQVGNAVPPMLSAVAVRMVLEADPVLNRWELVPREWNP